MTFRADLEEVLRVRHEDDVVVWIVPNPELDAEPPRGEVAADAVDILPAYGEATAVVIPAASADDRVPDVGGQLCDFTSIVPQRIHVVLEDSRDMVV